MGDPIEHHEARASEGAAEAAADDAAADKAAEGLTLYGYPQCPYCRRVLGAIDHLGLEIPLRNTIEDGEARAELIDALGRGTVPVLRIETDEGDVRWLPESADIVDYLEERFR